MFKQSNVDKNARARNIAPAWLFTSSVEQRAARTARGAHSLVVLASDGLSAADDSVASDVPFALEVGLRLSVMNQPEPLKMTPVG